MALLHRAELRPSKLDLIMSWAPSQKWFVGDAAGRFQSVGSYRFDDPDGEVGIETILVRAGDGPVLQIPLTYRGAPLEGAEHRLVGTMHHSVLGQRWAYDATGDPAYIAAATTAAFTGGNEAEQYIEIDGEMLRHEPTATVQGSGWQGSLSITAPHVADISTWHEGDATVSDSNNLRLVLARVLGVSELEHETDHPVRESLTGTWVEQPDHTTLALAFLR
jgi:hypothetical protein